MDFHGMKRKDLQALCKKHGIPANLKNIEMANRLASVLQKETLTDTISLPEDSVEVLEDDIVVKRVRFSPENEVFEFTRSIKRCQRKNVKTLSKRNVQDLQESGIELRRSTRIVAKGNKTVAGSNVNESTARRDRWFDVTKGLKVPRRLKRIGSTGTSQVDYKVRGLMPFEDVSEGLSEKIGRRPTQPISRSTPLFSKTGDLLPVKPSKLLVDIYKEDKLVKNNVKEVLQDDPKFEKVSRRSRQSVNCIDVQTNTQDQRRSIRLKARAANPSMEGESSDGRPLCSAKESKEEIKTTKQSKRSMVVNSREGELVKDKAKEPLIDCKVQTTEDYRRLKVQDASKVENVPRRSKRRCNDINVLMDKRPIKAVKRDDLGVKKAPKHSRQRVKSLSELLVDGQAQKGGKQPKRTFGNDREGKKLLQCSKHTASDKMLGQALSDSLKSCSVIDCERDGVGNVKKSNVNDEMQVRVRVSRSSSRHHSFKVPIEVERNLIEKKTDETLDSLVKSSKRVTRMTKRDRSEEPGKGIETASTQGNLTPKKGLDEYIQFDQEEGGGANVESRGSSKKSKTMNQECVKDKPQGMIENSLFLSETKAAEFIMTTENVLDSTLEKSVDSSQRTNIQELNSELMEGNREEKLERDTVSMVESEVSEHSSIEAILENSAECWKEIHPSKDGEKGSVEKEAQGANLHGNCIEYNTENNSAEEEMEITKVGCVNLTPEKLVDEYTQLEPEEAEGVNIEARGSFKKMKTLNHESVKYKPQGMTEKASPFTSETNGIEHVMISEDVLKSTRKVSGDFSPVRNTQELDFEPLDGQHEEKYEQDTVLMAAIEEKEETSSLSIFQVDCGIFTTTEKHILLETGEGVKEDNITAKSHVVNDVLAAAVPQSLMGDSELDEAERYREIKDVEMLGESNTSTHPERQILFGNSVLDETKDYSAATCEVAFVLTSAERQLLVNSKPYSDGKQEQKEVDDSVVQENTIVDSSGSIASKVSYNHELNAGQETAGAEDVVGLDATQGTSKKSREHSPHVDTEEAETIMEAEKNISFSSFVALPDEGNSSETIGEISSYLEVAGTCSMVSVESGPSTDIQNQINDALEEWAITDNNEVDELVEAKVTENIQKGFQGNLLLNSSGGGSNVSGETCILGETEDEDEAAVPIAIAVEKAISLTPDELTVQNHINEKAADEEMITRESTPIPEETMNESSENRKEYLNIDESATLSERQVRREPTLIFRTQVKPTKHDMKENAPNSKIVHNLNVTAPRTSKRPPLQDLSKN